MTLDNHFLDFRHSKVDVVAQSDMILERFAASLTLDEDPVHLEVPAPHEEANVRDFGITSVVSVSIRLIQRSL